mmetsp:Transcript_2685/g.6790  ORF Transcript_2685/g.6790 Transcript_2685/m.6790 type:complete len:579 (-) Transcript_2685:67-1803(-)
MSLCVTREKEKRMRVKVAGDVCRLFRGKRRPAGSHLQVDVFSLCSASVVYSMVLVADEVAAVIDTHKSRVVFVSTTSVVLWNVAQAFSPLIVMLINVVGNRTLAGASTIAIAAGLRLVGGAVQTRDPGLLPLFLGWAVLIGVGCSVLQVTTLTQARLHFSTKQTNGGGGGAELDAARASCESLTFVSTFLLIFFHHIQIALCGLSVQRVIFNESILCVLIGAMTLLKRSGSSRGTKRHLSSQLLHRDWERGDRNQGHNGSSDSLPTCQRQRWRGAAEGDKGRGHGQGAAEAAAVTVTSEEHRADASLKCGSTAHGVQSKSRGLLGQTARHASRAHFDFCDDFRWAYLCVIHVLVMTPLIATLILMPVALRVLFSPPLALRDVTQNPSSPTIILIGLVTYGACQMLTFRLRKSLATDAVYTCISGASGLTLFLTPLLASEQTHALFVVAQCLQVSLIAPINHLIPDLVGGFVECSSAANTCIGCIRIATALASFLAVLLGSGALGIPFFSTHVNTDPVFIEKNVCTYFVSLAFMQFLAVAAIRLQKVLKMPAEAKQQNSTASVSKTCPHDRSRNHFYVK